MQEGDEGGRYVVQSFDAKTWSFYDTWSGRAYVLALTELSNLIVHLSLTEVAQHQNSRRHIMYLREIMSCHLKVSSMSLALKTAQQVVIDLQRSDIDNPIDIALMLGADLYGQPASGANQRAH